MQIVRTIRYLKDLKRLRVSQAEQRALEQANANDPTVATSFRALAAFARSASPLGGRGKSGGGRAIYFLIIADDQAIMLMAYAKNEQADLTQDQRKAVLAIVKEVRDD